ncbi:MAG: hypothetical protein ACI8RZ_000543 [Myxococcota bacterium]|jgi:hypothetical protein
MSTLLLLLVACNDHTEPATHTEPAAHTEPTGHAEPDHTEPAANSTPSSVLSIALNDGVRWRMDPHTREAMGQTRATLASASPDSAESTQALGATLQGQLDTLIGGCTMTGADHDALHEFLMVYMPAVKALQAVEDDAAAQEQVAAIQVMVKEYGRFFE